MVFKLKCRKIIKNAMLSRTQFVVDVLHPQSGSVPKKEIADKLATQFKCKDKNCIFLFGFKSAFGGGKSTGFGLIYDNVDKAKKFEPKHRLTRAGLIEKKKSTGRRGKKETKNRAKKARGKERAKVLGH